MRSRLFVGIFLALCLCGSGLMPSVVYAAAQVGTKMPAFQLQALDQQFYGTEKAEGKITLLYFLGHNCAPCVASGPYLEQDIWQNVRSKPNVQMMGLDLWNGSISELTLYKNITGITFPLLRQAALNRATANYAGAGLSDLVVLDQEGIVRLVINGEGITDYPRVMAMIASLESKTPLIEMPTRTLYYGHTMAVGQTKTAYGKLINTGPGTLEITGMSTSIANLTMAPSAFAVGPYETVEFTLSFTPTQIGPVSGSVTLQHNDKNVKTLQIPLTDVVVEGAVLPSITLAQTSLDFGDFLVFAQSFGKAIAKN